MEIGKTDEGLETFRGAIASAQGDSGTVRSIVPKFLVDIRDLEVSTAVADVETALERELGPLDEAKVHVMKPNTRGHRAAVIQLKEE